MSLILDLNKRADDRTKLIINGYIRNAQQILPSNQTFYIIPSLIIQINKKNNMCFFMVFNVII